MFKLLATDIDGTILAHDGSLPDQNRVGLKRLHAAGVTIVFASGRADIGIKQLSPRIITPDDNDYLIAYNGARIVTADTRRPVFEKLLSSDAVAAVVAYCRAHGLYVQAYDADDFVVEAENDDTLAYSEAVEMTYRVVEDLTTAVPRTPKLLVIGEHELLTEHLPHLQALGGSGSGAAPASAPNPNDPGRSPAGQTSAFQVAFSKPRYLEIVAAGVDKGTALVSLANRLGVPIDQTIALGDSGNDVPLLVAAGTGVAVGDARDEAKTSADEILESGADGGIMDEVIARFFPNL